MSTPLVPMGPVKEDLRRHKLKTTGTKAELTERLLNHIRPVHPRKHPLTGVCEMDVYLLSFVPRCDLRNLMTCNKYINTMVPLVVRNAMVEEYEVDIGEWLSDRHTYYSVFERLAQCRDRPRPEIEQLSVAVRHNWVPLVGVLAQRIINRYNGGSSILTGALIKAIRYGRIELVTLLIESGADIHDSDGGPIRASVEIGNDYMFYLLVSAGATTISDNAILYAIEENNMEYIRMCIDSGTIFHEEMLRAIAKHRRANMMRALNQAGKLRLPRRTDPTYGAMVQLLRS